MSKIKNKIPFPVLVSGLLCIFLSLGYSQPEDPIGVKSLNAHYEAKRSILKLECNMDIPKPWHINSDSLQQEYLIETKITMADTSKGYRVKKKYPKPHQMTLFGEKMEVFEGNLSFTEYFYLNPGTKFPLEAQLQYQACSDKICLPPKFKKITVEKTGEKGEAKYTARM